METSDNKPLFTLTAEEVELVIDSLEFSREMAIGIIEAMKGPGVEVNTRFDNLLNRIKQWQDENKGV